MTPDLVCPECRAGLVTDGSELACPRCTTRFASEDGIRVLVSGKRTLDPQLAYFDDLVDAEFEIERPACAPALHAWLLREKFRRAVGGLSLAGATVLVVCGGSGMDAEFLARAGAAVISSDFSIGAARRARERARRHRIGFDSIVADVARLPFANESVDVVYVHDGLHHIDDPVAGMREMARVARRAVCITEPAAAMFTALAVRLGLALEREDAGNRVARLRLGDVRVTLEAAGFEVTCARRYALFYRHEPGRAVSILSRPSLEPIAVAGLRCVNALIGALGNKLVVQAVRR